MTVGRLNEAVISDDVIRMFQKKTNGYVSIPILKEVKNMVQSYSGSSGAFPTINQGESNRII